VETLSTKRAATFHPSAHDFSFEGMEKKEDYLLLKKSSRHRQAELFVEILS
jgi:hypothetical protein